MDTTGILIAIDRIRETQISHGELLRDHSEMLRAVMSEQVRTTRGIKSISQAKGSLPQDRSPPSSPEPLRLSVKDVVQLVTAAVVVLYVLKGGDIGIALKALSGG